MAGMKDGLGDDPFADDDDQQDDRRDGDADNAAEIDTQPRMKTETGEPPYVFRRDSVKDERSHKPIFLRDNIEADIAAAIRDVEDQLGEDVPRTDWLEAAVAIAQDNPGLVAEELRDWGFDYDWD